MNILVLGAGTFGTAIANELSVNTENNVILFSRSQQKVEEINTFQTNKIFFPNKQLNNNVKATNRKKDIKETDIIFIALPSSVIKQFFSDIKEYLPNNVLIVNLSKGIFKRGRTIIDYLKDSLDRNNIVTLKGASFAVELMEHADTLLTLGYTTQKQYKTISNIITNTNIHIDSTTDIQGVELLSVLKNIYALLIGVIDAKYNSPNTRFMFLTKAFSEIRILLKALGGKEDTLFCACGFGDLCLTSLNDLSRNRTLGLLIGKGFFSSVQKQNAVILEGLDALNMIHDLQEEEIQLELPLLNKLYNFFKSNQRNMNIDFRELIDR